MFPFGMKQLPAPRAPMFVDASGCMIDVKVGPKGKTHEMTLDELIRFAAQRHRCGR